MLWLNWKKVEKTSKWNQKWLKLFGSGTGKFSINSFLIYRF